MVELMQRRTSKGNRNREYLPGLVVMTVLIVIRMTLHLIAVSWMRGD
jgi:hypothetical protein